jgi:hypothetical protein
MGNAAPWLDLGAIVLFLLALFGQAADRMVALDYVDDRADHTAALRVPAVGSAIRMDLAGRLSVSIEDVNIESFETVMWADGCLGVHLAGTLCAQTLTPGFVATARHLDRLYRYHGAGSSFLAVDFLAGARIGEPLVGLAPARSTVRPISLEEEGLSREGRGLIR